MLKGFTHARLACGCRVAFREGVEGSPVTVVVDEKSPACTLSLHVRDLPLFDYREALRASTRLGPPEEEEYEEEKLRPRFSAAFELRAVVVSRAYSSVTIHSGTSGDLATCLRIDRDAPPRRRWLPWAIARRAVRGARGGRIRRRATDVDEQRAPEVEIAHATQIIATAGGSTDLPVLVATGYVVARHSSDVGVKMGGRLARISFEEGTRVRKGEVIAEIEHADIDAQLEASKRAVAEADAQLGQAIAARDEDVRNLERQRALMKDGITTDAALTGAEVGRAACRPRASSRRRPRLPRPTPASASPRRRSKTPTCARRSTAS